MIPVGVICLRMIPFNGDFKRLRHQYMRVFVLIPVMPIWEVVDLYLGDAVSLIPCMGEL